ncbi:SCO2322 family protein [Streptomyces sp. NPDC102340]|uniref:SCO2322 family protein n=1 Tax=unclassified Streptomyces TaxID=2593676 RepID=UPI0038146D08
MTARRSAGLGGLVFATLVALLAMTVAPAQAAGYRYWSFWEQGGSQNTKNTWTYATAGPSQSKPDDGDVQGFRFAVSADSKDAKQPRGAADFDTICSGTSAKDGEKRIALVIDSGTAADAPSGETPPKPRSACAQVAEGATSADALAAVAKPLRYDSSAMLCAISGYPKAGCGEQVSSSKDPESNDPDKASEKPAAKDSGSDGGPSVGLIAGVAVVVVLGIAAGVQARRRRR